MLRSFSVAIIAVLVLSACESGPFRKKNKKDPLLDNGSAFAETGHVDVHVKVSRLSLILADGLVGWPGKPQQPEGRTADQQNEEAA